LAEGLGIEAGCDGDSAATGKNQFERLWDGSGGGDGIGEDGDGKEAGSGTVGGERVRGGGLRGRRAVEALSEGMDGDAASLAEFGVGQASAAEVVEEGVPAEVEDVAPRHGVISRTGPSAPSRE
jgi:hypothetical protein